MYAFDVLMDIYQSQGYTEREAAQSILAHNLYGLDIDDRAYQLTYFALMMKARQYDRQIFKKKLRPNVCAIEESNGLTKWSDIRGQVEGEQMSLDDQFANLADELIDTFQDAKNYGSLLQVKIDNYDGLLDYMQQLLEDSSNNIFFSGWLQEIARQMPKLIFQAKMLSQKYWICATNPPYLNFRKYNTELSYFMKKNYSNSSSDLFAAFIERCNIFLKQHGFEVMITQHSWLSVGSFKELRKTISKSCNIVNLVHLGAKAFDFGGEMAQTVSFVLQKAMSQQTVDK